jgi:hypothetical protein
LFRTRSTGRRTTYAARLHELTIEDRSGSGNAQPSVRLVAGNDLVIDRLGHRVETWAVSHGFLVIA